MTHPLEGAATNRRNFLGLMGLGAATVASGGLLAGCSEKPTSTGTATSADKIKQLIPNYKANELLKPDILGEGPVADGYTTYPRTLVQAIKEKPGSGSTIRTMYPVWGTAPPGVGSNSWLDAVNSQLGAVINPSAQDATTYNAKLSAALGARDILDITTIPSWEINGLTRFSDAATLLFEDLTPFLAGDKVNAYPMLAALPSGAWEYSVWAGHLAAVPYPNNGPYAWWMYYRKDLADKAGLAAPTSLDELRAYGKKMTNPGKGVWGLGAVFEMVQQYLGAPGEWRKKSGGGLEHRYETPEFKEALEWTVSLYKDGVVHPDVAGGDGKNEKTLFAGGQITMRRDGGGWWGETQGKEAKVTPGFNMKPVPVFGAGGRDPVVAGGEEPIFYTFIKKGLGKDRVEEILRVMNFCAAPFGTKEQELVMYGVEGKQFTRDAEGRPARTELGEKEWSSAIEFLGGHPAALVSSADFPTWAKESIEYQNATAKYLEKDLFKGIKVELPATVSKNRQPAVDKVNDILKGRRPVGDLPTVLTEWRSAGGDEERKFREKILSDNGR